MKQTRIFLSLFVFTIVLFFGGCQDNKNTIVQPDNTQQDKGKVMIGSESPLYETSFTNGDMDNGTDGYWKGSYLISAYQFNYSGKEYVSPTHSLNINASGAAPNSFAYWAQTFDASAFAGKKASVKVNVKYSDVEGDGVMIVLRGDDSELPQGTAEAFSTTQNKIIMNGSSSWRTVEVDLDPVPEGIKSLTIYMLISAGSGSVYFDDLSINASEPTPVPTTMMNGDLESGNDSPDFWWAGVSKSSNFNYEWSTDEHLSPGHSIKISSDESEDAFAYWAQTIAAEDLLNQKIRLTANIKASDLSGNGVYIAIRGDETLTPMGSAESFASTQGHVQIDGTFDWKQYSITLNNVPPDTKSLTFYLIFGENTSGTVYFDDLSITTY